VSVKDDAGKESGLGDAEQERTIPKLVRTVTCSQAARIPQVIMIRAIHILAPTFFQDYVARHLEEEIGPVEHADGEPKVPADMPRSPRMVSPRSSIDPIDIAST